MTEGFIFKVCSRKPCHHIVNNKNYCHNCVIANKCTDKDNTERVFEENYNEECVTVLGNNAVDDDIQSVANTLMSLGGNTLFNRLPDYNTYEDFAVPPSEDLEWLPTPPPPD